MLKRALRTLVVLSFCDIVKDTHKPRATEYTATTLYFLCHSADWSIKSNHVKYAFAQYIYTVCSAL